MSFPLSTPKPPPPPPPPPSVGATVPEAPASVSAVWAAPKPSDLSRAEALVTLIERLKLDGPATPSLLPPPTLATAAVAVHRSELEQTLNDLISRTPPGDQEHVPVANWPTTNDTPAAEPTEKTGPTAGRLEVPVWVSTVDPEPVEVDRAADAAIWTANETATQTDVGTAPIVEKPPVRPTPSRVPQNKPAFVPISEPERIDRGPIRWAVIAWIIAVVLFMCTAGVSLFSVLTADDGPPTAPPSRVIPEDE